MDDQRKIVFDALKDRFHKLYRFDDFCNDYKNWNFEYIYKNGLCVGAVIIKDGYIHIIISNEHRKNWATKGLIKRLLINSMVDGVVKTTIFKNDEYRITFAKRLGFKLTKDGEIQTYEVKHEELWQ